MKHYQKLLLLRDITLAVVMVLGIVTGAKALADGFDCGTCPEGQNVCCVDDGDTGARACCSWSQCCRTGHNLFGQAYAQCVSCS